MPLILHSSPTNRGSHPSAGVEVVTLDVSVNVGIGQGTVEERIAFLGTKFQLMMIES